MAQPTGVTSAPRTFGILSVIFASIVLVGSLFGLVGLAVPSLLAHAPPSGRAEDAQALAMISRIYFTLGICSAIFVVMSALLLVLGIGQMRYRRWAAIWSPRWGIVALGAIAIMATLFVTTGRSMAASMATAFASPGAAPAPAMPQMGALFGGVYAAMLVMFYAPYPILLLACFTRARIREAMTQ